MIDQDTRLLLKVSYLYYVEQQNQEAIAGRLSLSRSKVSRMLARARDQGLVEVRIRYPTNGDVETERRFEEAFGLREAIIVRDALGLADSIGRQVASAAAACLTRALRPGDVLGISPGGTMALVNAALGGQRPVDVTVVQLFGQLTFGGGSAVQSYEITRQLAETLRARYRLLLAPGITDRGELGKALLSDPMVRESIELARRATIALVGIGAIGPSSSVQRSGLLKDEDLRYLDDHSAVGEICTRYFDASGRPCSTTLDERVVGLTLEELRRIPLVIGVAFGRAKAAAILGALRGGYLNTLVTDEDTARHVLDLAGSETTSGTGRTVARAQR